MSARGFRLAFYIVLGLCLLAGLVLGGLWLGGVIGARAALLGGLGVLGVAGLAGLLGVLFRARLWPPAPEVLAERAAAARLARLLRQLRPRARAISRKPLSVPWYLFVGARGGSAMAELGYVAVGAPVVAGGLEATAWAAPHAVALRLVPAAGPDAAQSPMLAEALFRALARQRPSLGLNAVFVEAALAQLLEEGAAGSADLALANRLANRAGEILGLDLPVHLCLSGLETQPDLARAAQLAGVLSAERPLGGFLDPQEGALPDQVRALFDQIMAALDAARPAALARQLAPEYCAALVNAPMQLALLRERLAERVALLAQPRPPRQAPLALRSIAFIGAAPADAPEADPLGAGALARFMEGAALLPVAPAAATRESVTARAAAPLAAQYQRAAFALRENRPRGLNRRAWALGATWVVLGLLATFTGLAVESYLAHRTVNARMQQAFSGYYEAVGPLGVTSDTLVQRVLLLAPLRAGLAEYEALGARMHRRVLPDWSMEGLYRGLYNEALLGGFQLSLLDYLEKDMFAFNALADGVTLVNLATLEAEFQTDQRRHAARLSDYFTTALAEQGEVSAPFQTAFSALLGDLFALNQPPGLRNEELRTVVARTLVGLDTADLLYATLMRGPDLGARVDLSALLGPRFDEVFAPIGDAQAYLVPRAFTAPGFAAFFEGGEVAGLSELVDIYETVIGTLDPGVRATLSRRIAQRYTADYIAAWSGFLAALDLRGAEGWTDAQVLIRALASPSDNPIERLSGALSTHVALAAPGADDPAQQAAPPTEAAPDEAAPAPEATPALSSPQANTAQNIRAAFRPYLEAARAGDGERSALALFLAYARDVNLWVESAAGAAGGAGAHLFAAYQQTGQANPLAVLAAFSSRSDLGLVRDFGDQITTMIDEAAMALVAEHLNGAWMREVRAPFEAGMAGAFPFAPGAAADVPLERFAALFAPGGTIEAFATTYLGAFMTPQRQFRAAPTFLPGRSVALSPPAQAALRRIAAIRAAMFVEGKPYLAFRQRTGFLDPRLSRVEIRAGRTLHRFTHGPVRWDAQEWPAAGLIDNDLTLRSYAHARAVLDRTYPGVWSWFRLAGDGAATLSPALGVAETRFATGQGALVLQFDTPGAANPFAPGFFSELVLPEALIGAQGG